MGADDDREVARQEQIWAGLYGPSRAAELAATARAQRLENPDLDIRAVLKALEPDDEDDPDEAGTMRPGVG